MAKKILKIAGIVLGVVVLAAVGLIGWLTVREYRPAAVEELETATWRDQMASPSYGEDLPLPAPGDSLTILSQNTGYAGLGKDADFFMDGGKDVAPTGAGRGRIFSPGGGRGLRAYWRRGSGRVLPVAYGPLYQLPRPELLL